MSTQTQEVQFIQQPNPDCRRYLTRKLASYNCVSPTFISDRDVRSGTDGALDSVVAHGLANLARLLPKGVQISVQLASSAHGDYVAVRLGGEATWDDVDPLIQRMLRDWRR